MLLLPHPWHSDYPPWVLKRVGLESSGQRFIFLSSKTKTQHLKKIKNLGHWLKIGTLTSPPPPYLEIQKWKINVWLKTHIRTLVLWSSCSPKGKREVRSEMMPSWENSIHNSFCHQNSIKCTIKLTKSKLILHGNWSYCLVVFHLWWGSFP